MYFNVDMNNVRQRRNNVVIFNVEFYNVGKRRNNVVKMTSSKKNKKNTRKNSNRKNSNRIPGIQNFSYHFIIFAKLQKFLKDYEKYCIATIARTSFKPFHFINYQVVFNFRGRLVQVHND